MNVVMSFNVQWKVGEEGLADFRRKYFAMKEHIAEMQVRGLLPRGEIKWGVEKVSSEEAVVSACGLGMAISCTREKGHDGVCYERKKTGSGETYEFSKRRPALIHEAGVPL